jgi:predicted DCC family thiol-disulfide oxidoreductase YuxK
MRTDLIENDNPKSLVLYDGVCNFCIGTVKYLMSKDRDKVLSFAPIQSKEARLLLRQHDIAFANLKTIYFIDRGKVFKRSQAIFKIAEKLPYPWKMYSWFQVLPRFLTDFVYRTIARYRYKIFGKASEVHQPL